MIFIVPYRDREAEKAHFIEKMGELLQDYNPSTYRIFFIEQGQDGRAFNRGAVKNLGFIIVKRLYPQDYANITLVYNDLDTLPVTKGLINYNTCVGTIKHFYGFEHTLGGIFSIKGVDFERTNGFPNYWAWGFEDNTLNARVKACGLTIDRSQFYPFGNKNIEQKQESYFRKVNRSEFQRYIRKVPEGINTINNIAYDVIPMNDIMTTYKINWFDTPYPEDVSKRSIHDLRTGAKPFSPGYSERRNAKINLIMQGR